MNIIYAEKGLRLPSALFKKKKGGMFITQTWWRAKLLFSVLAFLNDLITSSGIKTSGSVLNTTIRFFYPQCSVLKETFLILRWKQHEVETIVNAELFMLYMCVVY